VNILEQSKIEYNKNIEQLNSNQLYNAISKSVRQTLQITGITDSKSIKIQNVHIIFLPNFW